MTLLLSCTVFFLLITFLSISFTDFHSHFFFVADIYFLGSLLFETMFRCIYSESMEMVSIRLISAVDANNYNPFLWIVQHNGMNLTLSILDARVSETLQVVNDTIDICPMQLQRYYEYRLFDMVTLCSYIFYSMSFDFFSIRILYIKLAIELNDSEDSGIQSILIVSESQMLAFLIICFSCFIIFLSSTFICLSLSLSVCVPSSLSLPLDFSPTLPPSDFVFVRVRWKCKPISYRKCFRLPIN